MYMRESLCVCVCVCLSVCLSVNILVQFVRVERCKLLQLRAHIVHELLCDF
jgi:hypothetical protein